MAHAPTGLAPVERKLLHQRRLAPQPPPTGLAPVKRGLVPEGSASLVQKPSLHRGKPGGGEAHSDRVSCRNPRSTGASPVGAVRYLGQPLSKPLEAPGERIAWQPPPRCP